MPGRAEVIFVATGVIILTILAQGMLLPAVIRWARFEPDTMVAAEFTRAHRTALLSAIHASTRSPGRSTSRSTSASAW